LLFFEILGHNIGLSISIMTQDLKKRASNLVPFIDASQILSSGSI